MRIGRWELVSRELPELTDREQRVLTATRLGYGVGATVFIGTGTASVITSFTRSVPTGLTVAFVAAGIVMMTSYTVVSALWARSSKRETNRRIAKFEALRAEHNAQYQALRTRLQRARQTGDPYTMMTISEAVMTELTKMREENDRDRS